VVTIVDGKKVVQCREVKNQSNCSNSGSSCILLQAYFLPLMMGNIVRKLDCKKGNHIIYQLRQDRAHTK
jgi:hypothetical protein